MRPSFGGSTGDLGSFFAGLYNQQEQQAKADAKQAEYDAKQAAAEAKAQQAANDQDALDQWQHGQSSDQEWLAYIANRVNTTTDPTEHEKWVKYQREYTQQISDNQADYQYKSHQMSLAQLIAYHKGVLAGLDKNSQAYRDRALTISQLLDQQASNDLNARIQNINLQIIQHKATDKDLLAAYQDGLKKTTNPDLKSQIQTEIAKLQTSINQDAAQGALDKIDYMFKSNQISGREAGRQIRNVAEQYFKNDQHQYYTVLESALGFEKYPGLMSGGAGKVASGGRARGGGGGSRSRTTAAQKAQTVAVKNAINLDRAYANRGKDITTQYLETSGRGPVIDPLTGKQLPTGPDGKVPIDLVHQIQLQTLDHYDHLTSLYEAKGDNKAATQAQKDKTYFIAGSKTTPGMVQQINTIKPADQTQRLMDSVNRQIANAAASNDPAEMLRVAADARDTITAYANRLVLQSETVGPNITQGLAGEVPHTQLTNNPKPLESLPDKALVTDLISTADALNQALTPGADPAAIMRGVSTKYIDKQALTKMVGGISSQATTVDALSNGKAMFVLAADGPHIVPVITTSKPGLGPDGKPSALVQDSQPDLASLRDANGNRIDTANASLVDGYFNINGTPIAAKVLAYPYRDTNYSTWVAAKPLTISGVKIAKGDPIPAQLMFSGSSIQARQYGEQSFQQVLKDSGAIQKVPVDMGWKIAYVGGYSDNGAQVAPQAWYGDPRLGMWDRQPNWLLSVDRNPDGSVRVNADGVPAGITYRPSVTAGMSRWIYAGTADGAKVMQAISDSTPTTGEMIVDALGNVVPATSADLSTNYYDPQKQAMLRAEQDALANNDFGRRDWYSESIQASKVDDSKVTAMSAFRNEKPTPVDFQTQPGSDLGALTSFGESLGIKFSTAPRTTPVAAPAVTPPPGPTTEAPRVIAPISSAADLSAPRAPLPSQDLLTTPHVISAPTTAKKIATPTAPTISTPKTIAAGAGAGAAGSTPNVEATATLPPATPKPVTQPSVPTPTPIRSGPARQA